MGNKRKSNAEKERVTIRFKELKSGNRSIYLDCYHKGNRTYEFLKLYLVPETGRDAADANREVLRRAELIRKERELLYSDKDTSDGENAEEEVSVKASVQAGTGSSSHPATKSTVLLSDMARTYGCACEIRGSGSGYENSRLLVYAIEQYGAAGTTLDDVDVTFCTGFVRFLKTNCVGKRGNRITHSTAEALYGTLSAALSMAVRLGLIGSNPVAAMDSGDKVKREYVRHLILSLEEIRRLAGISLPSKRHQVKEAFMFACYSGIRLTEIRTLQWKDLTLDRSRWTMHIGARAIDVPLTNDAMQWLPRRGKAKAGDSVFNDLPCDNAIRYIMTDWMKAANLPEDITFSISFHSYGHHNAKSRDRIREETRDATRYTRWRLNEISRRARQNAVEARRVQKKEDQPMPTDTPDTLSDKK